MDRKQMYQWIEEALIKEIAERVLQKLKEAQKQALVVYTGATIGFEKALENLVRLREQGFEFTVYLTESASCLLDERKISAALQPKRIYHGKTDESPELIAMPYPTVIVPAMTLNCAAHVAACQADTAGSRMIFDSLLRKKNVIIAIDGCCPDNGERREMGYEIVGGLRERLRSNIEDIRSYGAHLTVAENLYRKTMKAVMGEDDAPRISGSACEWAANSSAVITKRLLTCADVKACKAGSVLYLSPHTMITQLARDEARANNVTLMEQSE